MNAKVDDIMTTSVIKIESQRTIAHARTLIKQNNVGAVPVVDSEGGALGIVSSSDLLSDHDESQSVDTIMTEKIYTIPQYDDVSIAARMMRNHKIHHLLVTHEQKLVGIVSSFDLLKLVEDHRFVAKNAPSKSKRKGNKRS